jgi:uncharacterized protein (TIGR03435 family)
MTKALVTVSLGAFFCGLAHRQTATESPSFEVASVKVSTPEERYSDKDSKGRFTLTACPLVPLIARAYGVANDKVSGPGWIDTGGYDIVATYDPETTSGERFWLMMQNLLVERFKLAVHREQNPTAVYALVVDKKGPKLKASLADSAVEDKCSVQGRKMTCVNQNSTMELLARNLRRWLPMNWLALPVVDQTGLKGGYDFTLTWTMTDRAPDGGGISAEAVEPGGIDLFDAIRDQLGLKVEQRKLPVDRIVIDHIERVPTAN